MATNWEAKFGKGKWVTVRGARVYIQEGKGLGAALQKLAGKKKTIKSPERKIPKLDDTTKKVIKRNEEKIKKYNQTDPNTDWEEFVKIDDAARHARNENQKIKAKNEPGRGQTISDYRNPQFTKGDNLSPVGNRHVTSRVTPDASKTGEADQELNQLYAQRRPYGNRTYNDPTLKGSWEDSVKTVIKNARATRKANGTEGKLRSPVYADQKTGKLKLASKPLGKGTKTFTNEKDREAVEKGIDARTVKRNEETIKNVRKDPNAIIKPIKTSKARIAIAENSAIKRKNQPGRGEWQNSYDQLNAGDSTVANAFSKKTNRYPKIQQYEVKNNIKEAQAARKRHGTEGKLRSDVYKDDRRRLEDYLNNGYKGISKGTALSQLEDALDKNQLGSIKEGYSDGQRFQANGKLYSLSKRADGTWKVKESSKKPGYMVREDAARRAAMGQPTNLRSAIEEKVNARSKNEANKAREILRASERRLAVEEKARKGALARAKKKTTSSTGR